MKHRGRRRGGADKSKWKIPPSKLVAGSAAVIAAAAAVVAAFYAGGQIVAADQQKVASQQTQLLSLVLDIEQEPEELAQASARLSGAALTNTTVEYEDELTSDAQAAVLVIDSLGTGQVTPFEYVQVAKALAGSGDIAQALIYYRRAAGAAQAPPDTVAAALRNEGIARYELGQVQRSHTDFMRAAAAFKPGQVGTSVTAADADNNRAQSYLGDAANQAVAGQCAVASGDLRDGVAVLDELPPPARDLEDTQLLAQGRDLYATHCRRRRPSQA
jgi:tetratricopeptide (TPR) repeat protein